MRTIVFSDVHGEPSLIRAIITHSSFDHHADRLIFAGDAIEVGRDSAGALALLEELGAEFLVGNHEYALLVDGPLEGEPPGEGVEAAVRERMSSGTWKLVAEADGVLVSHAGISEIFAEQYATITAHGTIADFARSLNREFLEALTSDDLILDGVCAEEGPLWYRPRRRGAPLQGVVQIAGHTPVSLLHAEGEAEHLAQSGMYLVDPHVRRWRARGYPPPLPLRYAVIEDGGVRVVSS
jgi:hypothetical protein